MAFFLSLGGLSLALALGLREVGLGLGLARSLALALGLREQQLVEQQRPGQVRGPRWTRRLPGRLLMGWPRTSRG